MRRFAVSSCLGLAVLVGSANVSTTVRAEDRSTAQILKEINAVEMPKLPDQAQRKDRAIVMKYITDRQASMTKKGDLIGELYKVDPNNAELGRLLPERWQAAMSGGPGKTGDVTAELDEVIAHAKNEGLRNEAAYWKAMLAIRAEKDPAKTLAVIDAFIKAAPKDQRAPTLLSQFAMSTEDEAMQITANKKLIETFPDSRAAKSAIGALKKIEAIGKPFELEFTDAINGSEVSMKGLKGKVVVIDFWATWCGPCVAEMPNMKKLYSEFKDKGVEFIGVSLDQPKEKGGLDKLKEFVAKNEIAWPQYYQGNFWESEFSTSWGINSIPAVFLVDADGKLVSINARGKLDVLIPQYLKGAAKVKVESGTGGN